MVAGNSSYSDVGLFAIRAAVPHHEIDSIFSLIATEMHSVASGQLTDEAVERAKNQLCSTLFMNLENKMVHLEDLGRQVQMTSKRTTPKELSEKVSDVSAEEVQRACRRLLSTTPTFVVLESHSRTMDFASYANYFSLNSPPPPRRRFFR